MTHAELVKRCQRWLRITRRHPIVREPVAFEEWAWRTEMALVHTALRRATEGWGQKIFGDLAQTDAPHPSASKRLTEAAKENSRLRDEVCSLRRQLGEAARGREVA